MFKSFQDRYFVLNSSEKKLTYYQEAQKLNVKGFYQLTPQSVCSANNAYSNQPNVFVVTGKSSHGEGREELFLSAGTDELRRKWLELITKAIKV